MELEFFCKPGTDLEWFNYWRTFCHNWLLSIGLKDENLRLRDHDPEELCFYSKATTDFEFLFPFGWGELWGVADRTDYDLTQHQNTSGVKMVYREGESFPKKPAAVMLHDTKAFSLKGKNAIITGGNTGLGRGIAEAFAQQGANIAIMCRNQETGR